MYAWISVRLDESAPGRMRNLFFIFQLKCDAFSIIFQFCSFFKMSRFIFLVQPSIICRKFRHGTPLECPDILPQKGRGAEQALLCCKRTVHIQIKTRSKPSRSRISRRHSQPTSRLSMWPLSSIIEKADNEAINVLKEFNDIAFIQTGKYSPPNADRSGKTVLTSSLTLSTAARVLPRVSLACSM